MTESHGTTDGGPTGRDWSTSRIVVAGAGVAGTAAARALLRRGAEVTVVDRAGSERTEALAADGARIVVADGPVAGLLDRVDDLVVSPGYPPHHPLPAAGLAAGLEVYSEPELAWRLRGPDAPPWLAVTGTNGKTTTVTMLAAILTAAGIRTTAIGNIGEPLVDLPAEYEALAVELSSFQLHWSRELAPPAGALLNLADDHLEWHGSFAAYATAKTALWRPPTPTPTPTPTRPATRADHELKFMIGGERGPKPHDRRGGAAEPVAIGNLDDPRVAELLARAARRQVGFTLAEPKPGQLGVIDGVLVDAAFADQVELIPAAEVRPDGQHQVANALAAAALARAHGVPPAAVRAGLAGYRPQPHRNAPVAEVAGVRYVDDSKATNPHAALASLTAYPRVVWVAGGQLKGVDVGPLVAAVADRLVGAVLLGVDRAQVAAALTRHAPDVPVREVADTTPAAMTAAVAAAATFAVAGDTVLLAPAAASKDMFTGYDHRGEAFAAAVRELAAGGAA